MIQTEGLNGTSIEMEYDLVKYLPIGVVTILASHVSGRSFHMPLVSLQNLDIFVINLL